MFDLLLKGYAIYPSTMLVQRDLFDSGLKWNELKKIKGNEDFDFSLRCSRITDFIYVDERLTNIGRHRHNLSSDLIGQAEGDIRVLDMHLHCGEYDIGSRSKLEYYRGKRLCGLGYNYFRQGDKKAGRRKYLQAMTIKSWLLHALLRYIKNLFCFRV